MWHSVDGMGWWMLWGGLMMVLFWGLTIALIVWGIRSLGSQQPDQEGSQSPAAPRAPLEIAKERYARGEIDRAEFEDIRSQLENG